MTLIEYVDRLQHRGQTLAERLDSRWEAGCSDCGKRLTLDREVEVSVCVSCQDAFLRSVAVP